MAVLGKTCHGVVQVLTSRKRQPELLCCPVSGQSEESEESLVCRANNPSSIAQLQTPSFVFDRSFRRLILDPVCTECSVFSDIIRRRIWWKMVRLGAVIPVFSVSMIVVVGAQLEQLLNSQFDILPQSCIQEMDYYRQCLQTIRDDIDRRFNDQLLIDMNERVRSCLISNGCKDPLDAYVDNGLTGGMREKCLRVAGDEARSILSACVKQQVPDFELIVDLPTLDDDVAEVAYSEFPNKGTWGWKDRERVGLLRSALRALTYLKSWRVCDVTSDSVAAEVCLAKIFSEAQNQSSAFDRVSKAEQKFNFYCAGRDRCRLDISPVCRKYLDDGKAATCRCARLELFTRAPDLSRIFNECVGNQRRYMTTPRMIDDLVRQYCSPNKDPCSEGFPPNYQLDAY